MLIDRNKDTDTSYTYNVSNGSVVHKSIKQSFINTWLNKCHDQFERTNRGSDPSIFFPISLFSIGCWIIIFFAYFTCDGITLNGLYLILGIFTTLNLLFIWGSERNVFWYVPICISLILLFYILYIAPYIVHKHVEDCKTGQTVVQTGKITKDHTCIYEGYIINHLNEFK